VFTHKVPSTVADQSIGVVQGVVELCAIAGVAPGQIDALFHGTTVATNIVIERDGAEVGMITTKGFRDILHMGRHKRPHNFSLQFDVPWQSAPLIKRRNRIDATPATFCCKYAWLMDICARRVYRVVQSAQSGPLSRRI
jgi:N-methylhydantoinase A